MLWPDFLLTVAATGVLVTSLVPNRRFECVAEAALSRIGTHSEGFVYSRLLGVTPSVPATDFPYPGSGRPGDPAPSLPESV